MTQIGGNFHSDEFKCKGIRCCGGVSFWDWTNIAILEYYREFIDEPVIITSGFRCWTHNSKVQGSPTSTHPKGAGVDFKWPISTIPHDAVDIIKDAVSNDYDNYHGLILYDTHIHLDHREDEDYFDDRRTAS